LNDTSPYRYVAEATRRPRRRLFQPQFSVLYTVVGLVIVGALLLLIPPANHSPEITPIMDAVFTATSAVTVTGLVVQDTATYWSGTGQSIILFLMFIGGLGFMSVATFVVIIMGHRLTLAQRLLVREGLGTMQLGGLTQMALGVVVTSILIQLVGFVALAARFLSIYPPYEAIWYAGFQSVAAFNNAGFTNPPSPAGLTRFQSDPAVLGTRAVLIILGGLSYAVLFDLAVRRRISLLALNTKLVITFSLVLWLAGVVVFLGLEYNNPNTLGNMPMQAKLLLSLFQSVSARTAGFEAVPFSRTSDDTNFFFTALMFIGGASTSIAGGIKVNTMAIVLIAIISTVKGREHPSAFGREIPQNLVQRALAVGAVAVALLFMLALMLALIEERFAFLDLLFEVVSAFGTVGLSTGITAKLSLISHIILIATMIVGKVGPLTLALAMARRTEIELYSYAKEQVAIG